MSRPHLRGQRAHAAALTAAALVLGAPILATAAFAAPTPTGPAAATQTQGSTSTDTGSLRTATARPLPERLQSLNGARQVVVVTAKDWSTSFARLQAWQLGGDDVWRQVMAPIHARVGWNGFAPEASRMQNSGETPAGSFRLLRGFGIVDPGGVDLPYRVVDANDWWPYDPSDPKTYNVLQQRRPRTADWRTSWAEDLDSYRQQYRYAVVIDYNLPSGISRTPSGERIAASPADTRKGGGIFLHVNGSGATAGCVSVRRSDMRWLLRWFDPNHAPRIVMGPRGTLR